MNTARKSSLWSVGGLRTRFTPRTRFGQGLVSAGPWVDLVLLLIMMALIHGRFVLQPGVVVALPEAPFEQGTRLGLTAVVLSRWNPSDRASDALVFFDDERYVVNDAAQRARLREAFAARLADDTDAPLVIQADASVPHGTVMTIVRLASDVGITRINVATRSH